ncbi:MAG: formate dehydrogenase [Gammaproteobacteria bacterium]|nr:formate dehydrogenase [Gammaproteobacteria bacterium]
MTKPKDKTFDRRAFLRTSAASTALAAAAPALAAKGDNLQEQSPQLDRQGYRLTPHIEAYYQTLKS